MYEGSRSLLVWLVLGAGCVFDSGVPVEVPPFASAWDMRRIELVPCRFELGAELTAGADHQCGDLLVPEDRSRSEGRRIRLHFIVFPQPGSQQATVYLHGGPGGSLRTAFAGLRREHLPPRGARGTRVYLAQRGVEPSSPALDCRSDDCRDGDCLAGCRRRLGEQVQLAAYTTAASADDVDELRQALGYARWNVEGTSYGSRLALEVLRRHESGVRAALIDGVVPAQVDWLAMSAGAFDLALQRLDGWCQRDPACALHGRDLHRVFVEELELLERTPWTATIGDRDVVLDGRGFAGLVFSMMYRSAQLPRVPQFIAEVAARRLEASLAAADDERETVRKGRMHDAIALYYSVVCSDLFNPPDESGLERSLAGVPPAIATDTRSQWQLVRARCDGWPRPEGHPEEREPVRSAVPVLVASGDMDPVTSERNGQIAAETLSAAQMVTFVGGHGAASDSACGRRVAERFLAAPDERVDAGCIGALRLSFAGVGDDKGDAPGAAPSWPVAPVPSPWPPGRAPGP